MELMENLGRNFRKNIEFLEDFLAKLLAELSEWNFWRNPPMEFLKGSTNETPGGILG